MALTFDDLLSLNFPGDAVAVSQFSLVILGQPAARQQLVQQLMARPTKGAQLEQLQPVPPILFGYSILTAPFPLLMNSLNTERNTLFKSLSLFGWVEDNFINEPRAEMYGLTPFGEEPVMFLRDLDLDRPVEGWMRPSVDGTLSERWLRVAGIVIADPNYPAEQADDMQTIEGDQAALAALSCVLPADTHNFLLALTHEVGSGKPLRAVLRARRKTTDDALMHVCDGWRILTQAVKVVRLNPFVEASADASANLIEPIQLAKPRTW